MSDQYNYPDPDDLRNYPWLGHQETIAANSDFQYFGEEPPIDPALAALDANDSDQYEEEEEATAEYLDDFTPRDDDSEDEDYQLSADEEVEAQEDDDEQDSDQELSSDDDMNTAQRKLVRKLANRKDEPRRRGAIKGVKVGPRKAAEPGPEIAMLLGEANSAFIAGRLDEAEDTAFSILTKNNEIFAAYILLSEIQFQRGDIKASLITMISAAHLKPKEPGIWQNCAQRTLQQVGPRHKDKYIRQAIYCLSQAININSKDFESRVQRAGLNKELRYYARAVNEYDKMLQYVPYDMTILRGLAEVCMLSKQYGRAISCFERAIDHYRTFDDLEDVQFTWADVTIASDLYVKENGYKYAIVQMKSLSRWLLGRQDQEYWDEIVADDRELDLEDEPRRTEIPQFDPDSFKESQYGIELPLELRVKLGLYRLKLGAAHFEEAFRHFSWLDPDDDSSGAKLYDYPDLFKDAADGLAEAGFPNKALSFYEPIQIVEDFTDFTFYGRMGKCYESIELYKEAEQCFRLLIEKDDTNPSAYTQLAQILEKVGSNKEAIACIKHAVTLRKDREVEEQAATEDVVESEEDEFSFMTTGSSNPKTKRAGAAEKRLPLYHNQIRIPTTPRRRSRRRTQAQQISLSAAQQNLDKQARRALEREQLLETVSLLRMKVEQNTPGMREGDRAAMMEWISSAKGLADIFCTASVFFPSERLTRFIGYTREAKQRAWQLKSQETKGQEIEIPKDVPNEYLGWTFEHWLDLFLEYATTLTRIGDHRDAYTMLDQIKDANIFLFHERRQQQIHACLAACALHARDESTLVKAARWFMTTYQFMTEPCLLFTALCRMNRAQTNWFNAGPSQKFVLRQIKALDYELMDPKERRRSHFEERAVVKTVNANATSTGGSSKQGQSPPRELNVALLVLYGQMLYCGTSYAYALNYFLRALALEPENPIINLCTGLSYVHFATKRQSENRHQLIMQGVTFMMKYYRLRRDGGSLASERQEAEYNVARMFHLIGLNHLAVPYYQRVLEMAEQREEGSEVRERYEFDAAYNMKIMATMSGNVEFARELTEKYLVLV